MYRHGSTEGLKRGQDALNTGDGITIPVGKEALGDCLTWSENQ